MEKFKNIQFFDITKNDVEQIQNKLVEFIEKKQNINVMVEDIVNYVLCQDEIGSKKKIGHLALTAWFNYHEVKGEE